MNLAGAFAACARKDPEKVAISWGQEHYCYGRLLGESFRVAERLKTVFSLAPGDRVGIWLRNCPQYVPAIFGILEAGGVVVPINNFFKTEEAGFILEDAGIDLLISEKSMAEAVVAVRENRPSLKVIWIEELAGSTTPWNTYESGSTRNESDLAVLIYTSGTTGHPKGAMLSHGNLLSNVESCRIALETIEQDRFAVLLPMFHSFMLTVGIFLPLLCGSSIVIIKSLHPVKNSIEELIAHRVTLLPAVPQFFRALSHPSVPTDLPLRLCLSGGAPLPLEILKQFNQKFSIPLVEGYGLSEASPVVALNPLRGLQKPGSIGLPIPNVEVCVQNETGQILAPFQTGEICVRGANVMQGYWNLPEATAETLQRGWLLTGDVGHCDTDGYFYITDRKKDMLLVNGINVYPREVEEVLYQCPGVREAAVIGIPDIRKGEQPLAMVVPEEGVTLDESALVERLREHLADYKVPRHIEFLAALPKNATGKVLKTVLRQKYGKGEE